MIKAAGVDITSIARIEKVFQRWGGKFLRRVFTQGEIAYAMAMPRPGAHLAGRFAAKEALKKAAGTDFRWQDIDITKDEKGKPQIILFKNGGGMKIHISISHCEEYAVAFVIIEEKLS